MLVGLLFFVSPREKSWRSYEQDYRTAAAQNLEKFRSGESLDSAALALKVDSLYALVRSGVLGERIALLQDSLQSLSRELGRYRELLIMARELVSAGPPGGRDNLTGRYFSTAQSVERMETETEAVGAELDTLLSGIAAVINAGKYPDAGPSRVRWIIPSRLPVREACTSCHLPVADGSRVMLLPQPEQDKYPDVMAKHPPLEFGCTVCHLGSGDDLSFVAAHGPDRLGRPFRPGRVALRSCGICHAEQSPLRMAAIPFSWPESCARCHAGEELSALVDSSSVAALQYPLNVVRVREWLLRHWGEKDGLLPQRDEFEGVVSLLVSGERKTQAKTVDVEKVEETGGSPGQELEVVCPKCGRKFRAARGAEFACPWDGTLLVKADK